VSASLNFLTIRARSIIEPSCLAIRQAIRAKLYNKCLLFVFKKFLSPISPHNTCYLGPIIPMLPYLAWCLYRSQALISLLFSLLHVSISLSISPLLYLLLCFNKSWIALNGLQSFRFNCGYITYYCCGFQQIVGTKKLLNRLGTATGI
jgi:hypothetical protein